MVTLHVRLRTLVVFGLLAFLVYFVFTKLFSVVILMLVSMIVVAVLSPLVDLVERSGLPRGISLVIVMLVIATVIALIGVLVIPAFVSQIANFLNELPILYANVRRQLANLGLGKKFNQELNSIDIPSNLASHVLGATSAVAGFVATGLSVLIIASYLIIDAPRASKSFYVRLPHKFHHHARYLLATLEEVGGGYIRGQATTSLIIAVYTFVLMTVLKVPSPLPLAVIAAVGDVIPVIGIFVILVPLTLSALTVSVTAAIVTAVAIVLYTLFENNILFPTVYGKTLSLPPVVVFVSVIIGGKLLGFAGAILSLPIASGLVVVSSYCWDVYTGKVPLEIEEGEDPHMLAHPEPKPDEPETAVTTGLPAP